MNETCDGESGPGVTHHMACECRERHFTEIEAKNAALEAELKEREKEASEYFNTLQVERCLLPEALEQAKLEGARMALDAAAGLCETNDEVTRATVRFVQPKMSNNLNGNAYAQAIRALSPAAILKEPGKSDGGELSAQSKMDIEKFHKGDKNL